MRDGGCPRRAGKSVLERGYGFLKHSLLLIRPAHDQRSQTVLGIKAERAPRGLDGLVILARPQVVPGPAGHQVRIERIQFLGHIALLSRFPAASGPQQEMGESMPHTSIVLL